MALDSVDPSKAWHSMKFPAFQNSWGNAMLARLVDWGSQKQHLVTYLLLPYMSIWASRRPTVKRSRCNVLDQGHIESGGKEMVECSR